MINPRILILIGGHLATSPRAQKEAMAASRAGFTVFVRGGCGWDPVLAEEDRVLARKLDISYKSLVVINNNSLFSIYIRIRAKLAKYIFRKLNISSRWIFGIGVAQMLEEASRLKPDLIMVHSEGGLYAGEKLIRKNYNVGVDFEDWFSEDLPVDNRSDRPTKELKRLEKLHLIHAWPQFATTNQMATKLADFAGVRRKPIVVPNVFPLCESRVNSPESVSDGSVKLFWFSQTIGPSRGLEELAEALQHVKGSWELHLLGSLRGYSNWFDKNFGIIAHRVHLHLPVSNSELPGVIANFDVGLALETPCSINRDVTATNKIFEYLRNGLAVLATGTRGQVEIMDSCPKAGWVTDEISAEELQVAIRKILDSPEKLKEAKLFARVAAEEMWCWEKYEPTVINAFQDAIK